MENIERRAQAIAVLLAGVLFLSACGKKEVQAKGADTRCSMSARWRISSMDAATLRAWN
jgi:hypothetical protein